MIIPNPAMVSRRAIPTEHFAYTFLRRVGVPPPVIAAGPGEIRMHVWCSKRGTLSAEVREKVGCRSLTGPGRPLCPQLETGNMR